ncbi:MAG: roadblock/LC7 domain-containing protein [Acidiferrobacterales bacterium]|nr:roadblock/LC7 domain-containing protein [Acidiferrobacterales bacterium]
MNRDEIKAKLKEEIHSTIDKEFESQSDIMMISLGTTDGFHIKSSKQPILSTDESKMCAMSSTLFSLSKSCADVLENNAVEITSVETDKANFLFLKTNVLTLNCVLAIVASHDLSLAQARYFAIRLSKKLEQLPDQIVKS